MTSEQLTTWIIRNSIEFHVHLNDFNEEDVIIFIDYYDIRGWFKLLGGYDSSIFDEGGLECAMKKGYFAFWLSPILDYWGLDLIDWFKKNEK